MAAAEALGLLASAALAVWVGTAAAGLVAVAVVLMAVGVAGYTRRDLTV